VEVLESHTAAVLSQEQQQFLDVIALAMIHPRSSAWRASMRVLATDRGLALLVPHLVRIAFTTVSKFHMVPERAAAVSAMLEAVASNPSARTLSLYLHHAVPTAFSVALSGGGAGPPGTALDAAPSPAKEATDKAKKELQGWFAREPSSSSSSSSSAVSASTAASSSLWASATSEEQAQLTSALAAARLAWAVRRRGAALVVKLCDSFADEHRNLLSRAVDIAESTVRDSFQSLEDAGLLADSPPAGASATSADLEAASLCGALRVLLGLGPAVVDAALRRRLSQLKRGLTAVHCQDHGVSQGPHGVWEDAFVRQALSLLETAEAMLTANDADSAEAAT
jgi:hypothetical protein